MNYDHWISTEPADYDEKPFDPADDPPDDPEPGLKGRIARTTGIPTTRGGLERKIGRVLVQGLLRLVGLR